MRRDCRAGFEWNFFNRSERYEGTMLNYSESGAYIESYHRLIPRATILLHTDKVMIACERSDGCQSPGATLFAEIKWHRTIDEENEIQRFGAGIRYHH